MSDLFLLLLKASELKPSGNSNKRFDGFILPQEVWYKNVGKLYIWPLFKKGYKLLRKLLCSMYGNACLFVYCSLTNSSTIHLRGAQLEMPYKNQVSCHPISLHVHVVNRPATTMLRTQRNLRVTSPGRHVGQQQLFHESDSYDQQLWYTEAFYALWTRGDNTEVNHLC